MSRPSRVRPAVRGLSLPTRLALAAGAATLTFAGLATAGFDWGPGGGAPLQYDGERIGRDGTYPSATIAKIMSTFTLNEADARAKLAAMRCNIKNAIKLVKAQDAALGKCLEDALACERLCIDFVSQNANAAVIPDGTTDCTKDPINIGVRRVACTKVPLHHPDLYSTFTSLMHEALHASQSYSPGVEDANPDKARVQRRKKSACNEIEAENLENKVACAMIPMLAVFTSGAIPAKPGGAAGAVHDSLSGLGLVQRIAAAAALLARVQTTKAWNQQHIDCQNALKAAYDAFLASPGAAGDLATLNAAIRATDWFAKHGFRGNFDVLSDPVYMGGGGSGTVNQVSGVMNQMLNTGLTDVTDFEVLERESRAVVAGFTGTGQGALIGYEDTDNDGFFEPGTQQLLVLSSQMSGSLEMAYAAGTGDLIVLSNDSGLLHRVTDTNADGFPDTLDPTPVVAPTTLLDDVLTLEASDDGRTLFGDRAGDLDDQVLLRGETRLVLQDLDGDGFYETVSEVDEFEAAKFTPNFARMPWPGDTRAVLFGASGASIEVHRVNNAGNSIALLGGGVAAPDGNLSMPLAGPLLPGWLLDVRDTTNGISSLIVAVPGVAPDVRGRWEPRAPFNDPRTGTGVAGAALSRHSLGLAVSHGERGGATPFLSVYDPIEDLWLHGGPPLPDAVVPRARAAGASALGRHFALGGAGTALGTVESFDPASGQWQLHPPMPLPLQGTGVASFGDRIYVVGGRDGNGIGQGAIFPEVWCFDATADLWIPFPPLPLAVSDAQATVIHNGRLWVFGGATGPFNATDVVQVLDLDTQQWSVLGVPMPEPRAAAGVGLFNGRLAVFGGTNLLAPTALGSTDLFDPIAGEWLPGPPMLQPSILMAQGDSSDGQVVLSVGSAPGGQPFVQALVPSPEVGIVYCNPAVPNSTGVPSELRATGSLDVAQNDLLLHVTQLPHFTFGFLICSPNQANVPNAGGGQGTLCVGAPTGRGVGGVIFNSGPFGTATVRGDLNVMPQPMGPVVVVPGDTWNIQAWHRDANPNVTSNFSDAVSLTYQ